MDSGILYPCPMMQFCTSVTPRKQLLRLRTGKSFLTIQDIANGPPSAFSSRRNVQFTSLSVRTGDEDDGNTPPRSQKEKSKLAKQAEIISLFRRIQSSISRGETMGNDEENPKGDKEKPAAESVLAIIRESRKKAKSKSLSGKANRQKTIKKTTILPKKDKEAQLRDIPPISDFKVPRPPSNFLKRSPIPFPSAPRGKAYQPGESNGFDLQKLEGMKLAELKELAKCRGLKGCSKLNRKELMQLLISHS